MKSTAAALPTVLVLKALALFPGLALAAETETLFNVVVDSPSTTTTLEVAGIVTVLPAPEPLDRRSISMAASTDASAYLSHAYRGRVPAGATGAAVTRIASAMYALETAFEAQPHASAREAVMLSAAFNASVNVTPFRQSAYNWASIQTQPWYSSHVPAKYKDEVSVFVSNWYEAGRAELEGVTEVTSIASAPQRKPEATKASSTSYAGTVTIRPGLTTITQQGSLSVGPPPSTASFLYIWPATTEVVATGEGSSMRCGLASSVVAFIAACVAAAWLLVN
ncbi:hypothetical protein NKR23_g9600 [Pleurostoma richardsiae]|uniref:Uncharacterized protein n=1 Tax=Pleurostoma richardsiae TaxID=41990 RepID=A0AA38R6M2_9PEZI|nr:hypothetical protein NKR23_g9600 [Pleurostoma richardsiae]